MTQGIFVGHPDRTGADLWKTKNGVVRGKSKTIQSLNDAWESTNWDGLCGTPWQMVAPDLKLTKKVTADKEGAGPPLPRIVVERAPEAEPKRFHVLSADIEAHGHAQDAQRLHRVEKRQSHITMNAEKESERSSREP